MACAHELVLNGACYYCGSTDLDPQALSPATAAPLVPAESLLRRRPRPPDDAGPEEPAASGSEHLPPKGPPET